MSKGYFVRAIYEGKLDKQTEERISDALQRRGAFERNSSGGQPITLTIDGEQQEVFPVTYSDVDWNSWEEDGSEGTEIEVFVDNMERAHHLAHELRFCGMSREDGEIVYRRTGATMTRRDRDLNRLLAAIARQADAKLVELRKTNGGHVRARFDRGGPPI